MLSLGLKNIWSWLLLTVFCLVASFLRPLILKFPGVLDVSRFSLWMFPVLLCFLFLAHKAKGWPEPGDGVSRAGFILPVSLLIAGLLFYRFWDRHDIYPLFLEGESSRGMEIARLLLSDLKALNLESILGRCLHHYNLGLAFITAPFFSLFNDSYTTYQVVCMVFWVVNISFFLVMFLKVYGSAQKSSLKSLLVILTLVFLCLYLSPLRRYKWHPMSLMACVSIYFLLYSTFIKRKFWSALLAMLCLCLSLIFYHGVVIYLLPLYCVLRCGARDVPFAGMKIYTFWFLLIGVPTGLLAYYLLTDAMLVERFYHHITNENVVSSQSAALTSSLEPLWKRLTEYITAPMVAVMFTGLGVALARFRNDIFARTTLIFFVWVSGGLYFTASLLNPDWHCWLIIPLLGVLFYGLYAILSALENVLPQRIAPIAMVVLCAGLAVLEHQHYDSSSLWTVLEPRPVNEISGNQLIGVLQSARQDIEDEKNIVPVIPHQDFPIEKGGFVYSTIQDVEPYRTTLESISRFSDAAELTDIVDRELKYPVNSGTVVRVYLSDRGQEPETDSLLQDTNNRYQTVLSRREFQKIQNHALAYYVWSITLKMNENPEGLRSPQQTGSTVRTP